jgi:hypothetical protein
LEHLAAALVAARAGDAATVLREVALASAAAQVDLATGNAVHRATAAAKLVATHAAKVLQRRTGHFIIAFAMNLDAAGALLKTDLATG